MQNDSGNQVQLVALRRIGSRARGDTDIYSDDDVLAIVSTETIGDMLSKTTFDDLSLYTQARYIAMHSQGHLFTWHVYCESTTFRPPRGLAVSTPDLISQLGEPANYSRGHDDACMLKTLLGDALDSLAASSDALVYDAGILYIALRNLAIIASWCTGNLSFKVDVPYNLEPPTLRFPLERPFYQSLRQCRKWSTRGLPLAEFPSRSDILAAASPISTWADLILELTIKDKANV